MNKVVSSKEDILKASRNLIEREDAYSINIRAIAKEANISVGTIYNYYSSKEELIIDIIKNIWFDIFHSSNVFSDNISFLEALENIFIALENGDKKYTNFYSWHSTILADKNEKEKGRIMMNKMFNHIKHSLEKYLDIDANIRDNVFNSSFTKQDFIDFVFSFIISSVSSTMKSHYKFSTLKEVITRIIY